MEDNPKELAIIGMIMGICGAIISIIPGLWIAGIAPDIVGIVLSAIALSKVKKGTGGGKGMATIGLVCGLVGIVFWFIAMAALVKWAIPEVNPEAVPDFPMVASVKQPVFSRGSLLQQIRVAF